MSLIPLEYLLLFGVPENKVESLDGRTRVCEAFPDRAEARAHFETWASQLKRWQGERQHRFELSCEGCRVELLLPLNWAVHSNSQQLVYRPEVWPECPPGAGYGVERFRLETNVRRELGHRHHGGTELMLPGGMVRPFLYCFAPERERAALIGQAYHEGVPDLIIEVLTPTNRRELRGDKLRFYREVGVPEVWVVDPGARCVEVFRLLAGLYALEGRFEEGQEFVSQGQSVVPSRLFQDAVHPTSPDLWPRDPAPVGLQDFLTGATPRGSYEFYHGRARRMLAWESEEETEPHMAAVHKEMAAWSGPFRLSREGSVLTLEVKVDVEVHRRFLGYWHFRGNWKD